MHIMHVCVYCVYVCHRCWLTAIWCPVKAIMCIKTPYIFAVVAVVFSDLRACYAHMCVCIFGVQIPTWLNTIFGKLYSTQGIIPTHVNSWKFNDNSFNFLHQLMYRERKRERKSESVSERTWQETAWWLVFDSHLVNLYSMTTHLYLRCPHTHTRWWLCAALLPVPSVVSVRVYCILYDTYTCHIRCAFALLFNFNWIYSHSDTFFLPFLFALSSLQLPSPPPTTPSPDLTYI